MGRRREGVGVRVMDCRTEGVGGRLLRALKTEEGKSEES